MLQTKRERCNRYHNYRHHTSFVTIILTNSISSITSASIIITSPLSFLQGLTTVAESTGRTTPQENTLITRKAGRSVTGGSEAYLRHLCLDSAGFERGHSLLGCCGTVKVHEAISCLYTHARTNNTREGRQRILVNVVEDIMEQNQSVRYRSLSFAFNNV